MLRPTSSPGSSDPSAMWSSRILVTRFFAIVHHPALCSQTRLIILHTRLPWVSPPDEPTNSQRGSVGSFQVQPGPSRSGVVPISQKGRDALRYWRRTKADVAL